MTTKAGAMVAYEAHTSIHGYYVCENGQEYDSTLWHGERMENSF